jgi:hypothetical protein
MAVLDRVRSSEATTAGFAARACLAEWGGRDFGAAPSGAVCLVGAAASRRGGAPSRRRWAGGAKQAALGGA